MSAALGFAAARRAAVKVVGEDGGRRGAGLLVDLPGRGVVVLTCHHVARPERGRVRVAAAGGGEIAATYAEELSRPARDVAVLLPAGPLPELDWPLLHAPDRDEFVGPLACHAVSPGAETDTFAAQLGPANRIAVPVPYPPREYVLDGAFQLLEPTSVRAGISGSPVWCEGGVVGLVHFARDASRQLRELAFLNPVTAWCERLPELAALVEPFVPIKLREKAAVLFARAVPQRETLRIPGFRPDVYRPRREEARARAALERDRRLLVVGRHNTGKSRLVSQILRDHPDAVVIVPQPGPPPPLSDTSFLRSREVVLVFENINKAAGLWRPHEWFHAFEATARRTVLLLTSWNDQDLRRVEEAQRDALELLGPPTVFLGREEGEDLTAEEGWELARQIGMDRATFEARFDGTPGSLLVDEDVRPTPPADRLEEPDARVVIHAPSPSAAVPHNLPSLTSAYVRRPEQERRIARLLERGRLVTLAGRPGAGKTRLAIEVAGQLAGRYPDGVWFADLAAAREGDQVVAIVRATVGAPGALGSPEDLLVEHIRRRRALLILNGPDRVREATARFVERLVGRRGATRVLVTLRRPLGSTRERVVEVPMLDRRDTGRRLFEARLAEGGGSAPGGGDAGQLESLYTDVEGNAAALEITAAQVRETGVEHVAAMTGPQRAGPRAASDPLRRAVRRSLADLSTVEAAVFARLGALPDWFTLAAARAVATGERVPERAVLPAIKELADRALLLIDTRDPTVQRYRFQQSIRDVALAELAARGEEDTVRRRHAEYYLRLADRASRRLSGRVAHEWIAVLERERLHLRAALRWCVEHDVAMAVRLAARIWLVFVLWSRFADGRRWLDEVLAAAMAQAAAMAADDAGDLVRVLHGAAYIAYHLADYAGVERYVEQARAVRAQAGLHASDGTDEDLLALAARRRADFDRALALLDAAVAASRRAHDLPRLADRLNTLGNALRESHRDLAGAEARQRRSLGLFTRLGSDRGTAMAQCDLAYVLLDRGDADGAAELLEESLATRRRVRDLQGQAQSLNGLGRVERLRGNAAEALEHHQRALELFDQIGDALRAAETLEALGLVHLSTKRAQGMRLLGRAKLVRDELGSPRPPSLVAEIEQARSAGSARRRRGRHAPAGQPAAR